jgi:hypothetical protein
MFSRAVVWVWWRWAERHGEVVHHVLMSWLDRQNEELAIFVFKKLDGDLVNSHRLVIETENLEVQRNDLVSIGRDDLCLGHLGASTTDAEGYALGSVNLELLDGTRSWQLVYGPCVCFLSAQCVEASLDRINWYVVEVEFLSILRDGEVQN